MQATEIARMEFRESLQLDEKCPRLEEFRGNLGRHFGPQRQSHQEAAGGGKVTLVLAEQWLDSGEPAAAAAAAAAGAF